MKNTQSQPPPYDLKRLKSIYRRLITYMEEHMDPGLMVALLFFHWLQSLYIEEKIHHPIDDEVAQELDAELTRFVLRLIESESPDPELQKLVIDLHARIRSMFPRRILHQRDIYRHSGRLIDELENEMIAVMKEEGTLERWRNETFILWWSLRTSLDNLQSSPQALSPSFFIKYQGSVLTRIATLIQSLTPESENEPDRLPES